jgi:hypothetical protein
MRRDTWQMIAALSLLPNDSQAGKSRHNRFHRNTQEPLPEQHSTARAFELRKSGQVDGRGDKGDIGAGLSL